MASPRRPVDPPRTGPRFAGTRAVLRGTRDQMFLASGRANVASAGIYGALASAMSTAIFLHADYPTWRVLTPLVMWVLMIGAQVLTVRRLERNPVGIGRSVARLHAIAQLYLVGVVTVTGGLH